MTRSVIVSTPSHLCMCEREYVCVCVCLHVDIVLIFFASEYTPQRKGRELISRYARSAGDGKSELGIAVLVYYTQRTRREITYL